MENMIVKSWVIHKTTRLLSLQNIIRIRLNPSSGFEKLPVESIHVLIFIDVSFKGPG